MAYTDFISLANAKAYLGVDDTSRDTEITRIITSAVVYVEQHSCHIWDEVNKTYQLNGKDCIKVYDYPITAVVKGLDKDGADVALVFETDYDQAVSQSYTIYTGIDSDAVSIILTVGYDALADIPADLVEAAYQIIDAMFNREPIPQSAKELIAVHKRFIL